VLAEHVANTHIRISGKLVVCVGLHVLIGSNALGVGATA
jgi:hypothetical protein